MAGETPGAQKYSNQRRRLTHLDERSTDKTYRGDVSALGTTPGSVLPRQPATQSRRRLSHLDDRNTDKTYRADPGSPTAQQLRWEQVKRAAPQHGAPKAAAQRPAATHYDSAMIRIMTVDDVRGAIDNVVAQLNNGADEVVVEVAEVKGLLARARTRLETKVTQEIITEDQARDVRFSKVSPDAAAQMPTRVQAIAHTAPAEEGPPPVEPITTDEGEDAAAFLDGLGAVQDNPLFAPPEDDDYDEIPPHAAEGPEAGDVETEAADAGAPAEAPEETAVRPRGRRKGRGT